MARKSMIMAISVIVLAFFGSNTSTQEAIFTFYGDSPSDRFGWSVSSAGDVDWDGTPDLIIGAPGDDNNGNDSGSASIISGKTGKILYTFNGDKAGDQFGHCVSGAGDVNWDGYADVMVGAPCGNRSGYVRMLSGEWIARTSQGGTPATPAILHTYQGNKYCGTSISETGDVNKDGYDDVILVDGYSGYLLSGEWITKTASSQTPLTARILYKVEGYPGVATVSGAGDINRDGYPDFVAGRWAPPEMKVEVTAYSGKDGSLFYRKEARFATAPYANVHGVGDVNRDGYADVVAWGPQDSVFRVFYGPGGGGPLIQNSRIVSSVCGMGDVDHDGHADIAVGFEYGPVQAFSHEGLASLGSIPFVTLVGNGWFGHSVYGLGDVNHDGRPELAVGAPRDGTKGKDAGSVKVFRFAVLSGLYTIDPASQNSKNFKSIAEAAAALKVLGISGPITLSLESTTFQETVTFSPVPGASSTNTITLAASGVPAVIDANNAPDAVTLEDGCAYYRFENLKIQGFQRYGISLSGKSSTPLGCHDNTFGRVEVIGPVSGNTNIRPLNLLHSDQNVFNYCQFRGGGVPLLFEGMRENRFEGCEFDGRNMGWELLVGFKDADADNVFQNCFFHSCGPDSRGLYMNYDSFGNMFWHNTVIVKTTKAAAYLGSLHLWNSASSWRNNIIVNLGTGPAVHYGETPSSPSHLEAFDADHNCYYAPNTTVGTIVTEQGRFKGSLQDWKEYIKANPQFILPGGGTFYDQNSIEGNPGLVSMSAPYDIHLKSTSPCIDRGTTTLVAGNWITFLPGARVFLDREGIPRPDRLQVDMGAHELGPRISGSGSYRIGTIVKLTLIALLDPGHPYQVATSQGLGPIQFDSRHLYLTLDPIMQLSLNGLAPGTFIDYAGNLGAQGAGTAAILIPDMPELVGFDLHTAFVTLDPAAPSGFGGISNTWSFTVSGPLS